VLDRDEVIPIGASFSVNMNQDNVLNMLLSWFEPAGPDSMLPNFGGFLQLELSDLTDSGAGVDYAFLAQVEYMIKEKVTPYLRGGYVPVFKGTSSTDTTGDYAFRGAMGCYLTPVHFFSVDLRYEMELSGDNMDKNLISTVFTIRM
jgi:hypothetical protein